MAGASEATVREYTTRQKRAIGSCKTYGFRAYFKFGRRQSLTANPVARSTHPVATHTLKMGLWAAAVCIAIGARPASAGVEERLSRLASLEEGVVTAEGPSAITALRRLWLEWDQGDPAEVESALRRLSVHPKLTPNARVYASLLSAYARRRRGDYESASLSIQKLGYVQRWLTLGPFDNEGKSGFDRTYQPEKELSQSISLTKSYDGKDRPVQWRATPNAFQFGWVDLGAMVRPSENTCSFLSTFIRDKSPHAKPRTISIWAGAAGAFRVYWNGHEVLRDTKYRDFDADRFGVRVPLAAGYNRLVVKACGAESAPLLSLRIANAEGVPDERLEADPDATRAALAPLPAQATPSILPRVEGPIADFERAIQRGRARDLESYAWYLRLTQSDDPAEHKARELARSAAEKEPSVTRYILAGDLAEDRNQRAEWIARAESWAKAHPIPTDEKIQVALARAAHARTGVNWRDAMPHYDRVLALDPDNIPALLARFELYSEAGLKETAATLLERALERRPRSVSLLRALAALRREQERTTEADELSARYGAFRADDASLLRDKLDLALARRSAPDVAFLVDRLIATNPDSQSSLVSGAKAFVAIGDSSKAIALYKRALDLAPEDTDVLRALSDLFGVAGKKEDQIALLRNVLELKPQDKDVREYLAHAEPGKPRADEAYAHPAAEFLAMRSAPPEGRNRRSLVNLQVTTVFPNGLASRFHQVVFQPLTSSAADDARDYVFGFEADSESVQLRGARVYRANGQIDEAIKTGEGPADNPELATYTSARAYYVRFPRIFPGDVVELQYRVEDVSPRNAFADYFGELVYMQAAEPIRRAEYVLITPKTRSFYFNSPTGITRTEEQKGESRIFTFRAADVRPLDPEAHQPPYTETLNRVHVSTYKNWDEMGRWYWGLVKDQFIADDEVRKRAQEATKGLSTERDKVRAVYNYVVQKTRYVALEFGIHGFKPYRCAQIFARGFGDCKDKATLIVTMLKELGIPATIVIVRTGMKGDFDTAPASLAPFDHAIAYVPSLDLYLDGTAEYTGSLELPAMDRGALALQINEGKPLLVHLPDPPASESVVRTTVEGTLSAEGLLQFEWAAEATGASASTWRRRYHAEATRSQRVLEDLAEKFPAAQLASVSAGDLENIEIPALVKAKGKAPSFARGEGESWSIPVTPSQHLVKDFAPLESRKQSTRFSAKHTSDTTWKVRLPPGARTISAPQTMNVESPFGAVRVTAESNGGLINVRTEIALSQSRISAADYPAFREFCERADRALGQRLVYATK